MQTFFSLLNITDFIKYIKKGAVKKLGFFSLFNYLFAVNKSAAAVTV